MIRYGFCGFLIGVLLFLMSSCLGTDSTDTEDWALANAQIASFSVACDSVPELASVIFTIDQVNGEIFNKDSMPYGTILKEKVICTLTYEVGALGVQIMPEATGDTVSTTDSVDFTMPVKIVVYPYDGISQKTYVARLNIHQVNPDSIIWNRSSELIKGRAFDDIKVVLFNAKYILYALEKGIIRVYTSDNPDEGEWTAKSLTGLSENIDISQITEYDGLLYAVSGGALFGSADGLEWKKTEGAPPIKALLGSVPEGAANKKTLLAAITDENSEQLYFTVFDKETGWATGDKVPDNFPLTGFGGVNYESMYYQRLLIAAGRDAKGNVSDKSWSTIDGRQWVALSNAGATFSPREGASVFGYDSCLFLFGGTNSTGAALKDIYRSKDNGVTWFSEDYVFPNDFAARGFTSAFVDKENYILLFGGKVGRDMKVLNELWRGRINRLGFKDD